MRTRILIGLILSVALKAHAEDAGITADVRCVIVGGQFASSPDPGQRSTAGLLISYYVGHLDGRAPGLNLQRLIAEELGKLTPVDLQTEARRCSDALSAKGKEIARIGNELARFANK